MEFRLSLICFTGVCLMLCTVFGQNILAQNILNEETDKVELRKELDRITQELLIYKNPSTKLYHAYIFNSGVGNREELRVESPANHKEFVAGVGVVSWQSVQCAGIVYLLGRRPDSVSLVVTSTQMLTNRSAHLSEHSLSVGAEISSTVMFTRWNHSMYKQEVVVVLAVAVDRSSFELLWYRVTNRTLEYICRTPFWETSSMAATNVNGRNYLVITDTSSPTTVNIFDVVFRADIGNLDLRLTQSFTLETTSTSVTVCSVGRQLFLVFLLPHQQSLDVFRLLTATNTIHFENFTSLALPLVVSQVVAFSLANQVYIAVNGDSAYVFRLTDLGYFIPELSPGSVSEWLVATVSSYRDDVVLFSRSANITNTYVWAGVNEGFKTVRTPECDGCLEGDWFGAVSIPFHHQHCLLLPRASHSSTLVTIATSLYDINNPILDNLKLVLESIENSMNVWKEIQSKMSKAEEILNYIIKVDRKNIVTGKWKLKTLVTPELHLVNVAYPQSGVVSSAKVQETASAAVDITSLESHVHETVSAAKSLFEAMDRREEQVWGLDGFIGKVTFKGRLFVDNLTVSSLNSHPVNKILQNTYRKDRPQPIKSVVIHSLQTENIFVGNKVNNLSQECLKFSDSPVVIKGNVSLLSHLIVDGDVNLVAGGRVNGVHLSQELCQGESHCSVLPDVDVEVNSESSNNIVVNPLDMEKHWWKTVLGAKNLTIRKVNGVDWALLTDNVVYTNKYQNVSGTVVVKGVVFSEPLMRAEYGYRPQQRESEASSPSLQMSASAARPLSANQKIEEDSLLVDDEWDMIVSELEVTGTVTCEESVWGASAADVVISDANPVQIHAVKHFDTSVNVANNMVLQGTVVGLNVADLLTFDTYQVFTDPVILRGNLTLGNVTLTGVWNGMNISSPDDNAAPTEPLGNSLQLDELVSDNVRIMETLNGIPVSELVSSDHDSVTSISELSALSVSVTKNITVGGKVCSQEMNKYNKTRFSIQEEQNISGVFVINKANVTTEFNTLKINDFEVTATFSQLVNCSSNDLIHVAGLQLEGNITTDLGMNGYNLSEIALNAVWLRSNNYIKGQLTFKDEVTFETLECLGFFNQELCEERFDEEEFIYNSNDTIFLSGEKMFLNSVSVSGDLQLEEINGHRVINILTTTSVQDIKGDVFITGDITVDNFSLLGLLNNENLTEFGNKCSLSGNTIKCEGNAVFNENVAIESFKSTGNINGINFDTFTESLVDAKNPQPIECFKRFMGKTTVIKNLDTIKINDENWNAFLLDAINQNTHENIESPVVFTENVEAEELSVDSDLDADSINQIDLKEWATNAIYLNNSLSLKRSLHLSSASSLGNLSVVLFGDVDLGVDLIRLDSENTMDKLSFQAVNVTGKILIADTVNNHLLPPLYKNTLKVSGDQTLISDLLLMGNVLVSGNVTTAGQVNYHHLQELVTLSTDQTLHGNYKFECMEILHDMTTSGSMSGVNISEWRETAVLKSSAQEITGEWDVQGQVELRGSVSGPGRLADVDLVELTENISHHILDVHQEMKANLSSVCINTNHHLSEARSYSSELLYMDVSQEILLPFGASLVSHFKIGNDNYLVVCEKSCTSTVYKWDSVNRLFFRMYSEVMGFAVARVVALFHKGLTYLLTESSELPTGCHYSGRQLWLFSEHQLQHMSQVDILFGDIIQGHENSFYSKNGSGVFKWEMQIENRTSFFNTTKKWKIFGADKGLVLQAVDLDFTQQGFDHFVSSESKLAFLSEVLSNFHGEIHSLSVDANQQFVAVAFTERTTVPRYSDHVKVYQLNGQLFDKLPAQQATHLQWLSVADQTWLVFLQNHSQIHLYYLQGSLEGFQMKLSAKVEAIGISSISLPITSKVNPQPYIIAHTMSSVKILQAVVQGDPYLGPDLVCNFDEVLRRVPDDV